MAVSFARLFADRAAVVKLRRVQTRFDTLEYIYDVHSMPTCKSTYYAPINNVGMSYVTLAKSGVSKFLPLESVR